MSRAHVVSSECPNCGQRSIISLPYPEYKAWQCGVDLRQALPDLLEEEYEVLINGTCPECYMKSLGKYFHEGE